LARQPEERVVIAAHQTMMGALPCSVEFSGEDQSNLYHIFASSQPSVYTWTGWMKVLESPTSGAFFKYGGPHLGTESTYASGWGFGFGNSNFNSTSPGTKFLAVSEGNQWLQSTAIAPSNSWHHYAIVINGTAFTVYLDGVSKWSSSSSNVLHRNTSGLFFGGYPVQDRDRFIPCKMTRCVLWNRALSASEVAADYADGNAAPSTTSGLEHFWPMSSADNYLADAVGSATLTAGTGGVTISTDSPFA
jgi:hypothetical protein